MVTDRSCVVVGAVVLLTVLATCAASPQSASADRGAELFARHCTACHGERGAADTTIAAMLAPRPRAFADGLFHLVSTVSGLPTREDVVLTLQHGMPGSTMMAFEWLPEADLAALADHVLALAFPGRRLPSGPRIEPRRALSLDAMTLAAGERLYLRHCAACHGVDGRGCEPPSDWAGSAEYSWPRDFTAGFLRGGADVGALTRRILAGMPGAHMPPILLSGDEASQVVGFVTSLIPAGADRRHLQHRQHLLAVRTGTLPAAPATWDALDAVHLPTAPLRWRRDGVFEVQLCAAHDGQRLAIELEWDDTTRNDRALDNRGAADGVALQFCPSLDAPLLAMGSDTAPVEMWHWLAFRAEDVAGALDLLGHGNQTGAPVRLPGLTSPAHHAETVVVHGVGSMPDQRGLGRSIQVEAEWRDGHWRVVLTRSLVAKAPGEAALAPGDSVLLALAIWNGSIDLTPASKAITNWHVLQLQR